MQAARPALLLPLLLTSPFTSHAVPIPGTAILVEYEGTISEVSEAPPEYVVGDRIAGRLYIDRRFGHFGTIGLDEASYGSNSPAFVRGFWPSTGDGFDNVFIANEISRPGAATPIDVFSVEDFFVVPNGSLDGAKVLNLNATLRDLTDSVKLDYQSFEVTSAEVDEPDESLSGGIRFSSLGPFPFVKFVVDRLNVKPNHCVAP
jgi:hypothetical protein